MVGLAGHGRGVLRGVADLRALVQRPYADDFEPGPVLALNDIVHEMRELHQRNLALCSQRGLPPATQHLGRPLPRQNLRPEVRLAELRVGGLA